LIDLFASAALFLLLDQLSKNVIAKHVGGSSIALGSFIRVRPVASAKHSYKSEGIRLLLVFTWFAALACAILLSLLPSGSHSRLASIALGAALGGAAGNLSDILRTRAVYDFIDLSFWPTFNLADVAIIAGLIFAFWARS
jgi:signal peptidase II